ncbi:eukaryotic translation initiation factor 3 subunit F-1 [Hyalella azteca]|uniref:Eukaryotic translation initiation factor 3 subunit F n=1 Tax=Hyalella azteca TaxID=294128 RepID=A0A8B7NUH0_HYAAZ|nr:eukaryotic translation initiation factor 3 subunit F-1 [Hyalella azteca]
MALNLTAKVHPVVYYTIVDAYERRNIDAHRVIGTLLGSYDKGCIEVTNCFCVPHNESQEEVAVELDFAKDMHDLHRKISPGESIVGWWATGHEITDHSLLIHDYYCRVTTSPLHITVDTTLKKGKIEMKAYTSMLIGLPGKTPATMFASIPAEITSLAPEVVGVCASQKSKAPNRSLVEPCSDLQLIADASSKIEAQLGVLLAYIEDVLAGKCPADSQIGRELTRMVNQVPQMAAGEFEEMLNTNMKDLLMVVYLSQLTKVNVSLNEKLTLLVGSSGSKELH